MRWAAPVSVALASLWFIVTAPGAATAASVIEPAIRDFDIATMERLGRVIYDQDQLAWKASDVLAAQTTSAQRASDGMVSGWVTGTIDGKPRVRFLKSGPGGYEALYDVTFDDKGAPTEFSRAKDPALSPEEIAQFEARALAVKGAARKCSPNYNTVALEDPAGDGWLVWALAATTDADAIIIGGHIRFSISADGKNVTARDDLSKGCLRFSKRAMAPSGGGTVESLMVGHVVSLTPVETYVFSQLAYQYKIVIGTLDGRAWKVDGGRIVGIDMDMAGHDGFAARTIASFSERCRIIAETPDNPPKYVTADAPSMIQATESEKPFKIEMPGGYKAHSVMCGRLDIVPAPNDYKIVVAGYPLYILDIGVGHPTRIGALEIVGGQFRFRMIEGPALTDGLSARVQKRLEEFQTKGQATAVGVLKPDVFRGNAVETLYRLGHVGHIGQGAPLVMERLDAVERQGHVTKSPQGLYSSHTD
jgi:hypothetical protein